MPRGTRSYAGSYNKKGLHKVESIFVVIISLRTVVQEKLDQYLIHMTVTIYVVLQVIEKIKEYILIHMVFKRFLSLKNFIAKFQLKKCLTI